MDRFALTPVSLESEPQGNEHRLTVPDGLLLRRVISHELREEAIARLKMAVPDLVAIGNKCSLRRAPTETDLAGLRAVAAWYGFPFDATVRSDEQLAHARRVLSASKTGRWN